MNANVCICKDAGKGKGSMSKTYILIKKRSLMAAKQTKDIRQ